MSRDNYNNGYWGGGGYGGYGSSYGNRSSSSAHDVDDLRRKYEQMKEDNLHKLKNVEFEVDEKGETSYLGIPISRDMKPVIEAMLQGVKPFIIDQSENVYKLASSAAHKMGMTKSHTTVGKVVENVFRWGVVGTEQIAAAITASNKYALKRRELFAQLAPVMQATGSNLNNNEVIKVAYDELHNEWVSDMKRMVADLPALIPNFVFAWQDQVAANKRHKNIVPASTSAVNAAQAVLDHQEREINEWSKWVKTQESDLKEKYKDDPATLQKHLDGLRERENDRLKQIYAGKSTESTEEALNIDNKNTDKWLMAVTPFGAVASQIWKGSIEKAQEIKSKRVKAWKMIEHLRTEMENHCDDKLARSSEYEECNHDFKSKSPEDIIISGKGNREGDSINLREYVIELFQQHERDLKPYRNFYDTKTGKAIDPIKGTMLTNLMPAVDVIAEGLADGTISVDALYKLLGENKVIKHTKSGARVYAKEQEVREYIEKELAPVLGTRELIKFEEFTAKFANPALIEETLKKNLEAMHGIEKSLFASLFPDDILVQAGMKKAEIFEARKQAHEYAYDFVAANVMYLSKKSAEELKALGVSEKESSVISAFAEKVDSGDTKALKIAVDGHDKQVIDAVRTAGLLEQVKTNGKGANFWTERVKEMGAVHAAIKKNSEERKKNEAFEAGNDQEANNAREWAGSHSKGSRWEKDDSESKGRKNRYKDDESLDGEKSWGEKKSENRFSDRYTHSSRNSQRDRVSQGRESDRSDEASDYRGF